MTAPDLTAVHPPAAEAMVLQRLADEAGKLVTIVELHTVLYGDRNVPKSNVLQVLVGRLRKRMAAANCGYFIDTVRGRGYRLYKLRVATGEGEGGAA